jgi:hypothetical protein
MKKILLLIPLGGLLAFFAYSQFGGLSNINEENGQSRYFFTRTAGGASGNDTVAGNRGSGIDFYKDTSLAYTSRSGTGTEGGLTFGTKSDGK